MSARIHSLKARRIGRGLPEGPGERKALWRQKPPHEEPPAYELCPRFSESQEERRDLSVLTLRVLRCRQKMPLSESIAAFTLEP